MSTPPFVHLHCHSHYSLLDGQSKIPDLIGRVKSQGMTAVALTDHGNLFGAIEFLREAKAAGIIPIVGPGGLRRARQADRPDHQLREERETSGTPIT